ncbi:MAG TPA: hypothetical protein VFT69_12635 [Pseudolabrys sp.]|nr:hypothetical protein [Pseudolabrys sp.]
MKTLTTFTAIAALIASVSIAGAQTSTSKPSAMSNGSTKTHVTGKSKYCISSGANGWSCKYRTMAACEKAAKSAHKKCERNPNMHAMNMKKKTTRVKSSHMKSTSK